GALRLERRGAGPGSAVGKECQPGAIDSADAGPDGEPLAAAKLERAGDLLIVFPDPAGRSGLDSEPAASEITHGAAVAFELEQGRRCPSILHPWHRPTVESCHTPTLIQRHAVASPAAHGSAWGLGGSRRRAQTASEAEWSASAMKMIREPPVVESHHSGVAP